MFALETYLAAGAICDAAAGPAIPVSMVSKLRELADRQYLPIMHPGQHDILIEVAKNEILADGQAQKLDMSATTWGWNVGCVDGQAEAVREIEAGLLVIFRGCLTPSTLLLEVEVRDKNPPATGKPTQLEVFCCDVRFNKQQAVVKTALRSFDLIEFRDPSGEVPFYREIVKILRQFRNLAYFPAQESVAKSMQAIYARTRVGLPERD